ncbi:LysR family transcriptional regulator [Nocardia sp. NPDC059246]|uniref:LysR family transcriptional regulator n=1 Tax=unclassified Nocardia TaxID=2637762 RepID=UPI003677145F
MTNLDLAAVRAFVTAVDEVQFGYAAAVLGLTQQAVSKRIAKLEGQLGVSLFDRASSGSVVSAAGKRVLPHARSLLEIAADTVVAARPEARPLRIAVQSEREAAADLVRYYVDRHPEADIELVIGTAFRSGRDALLNGRVDATFARPHGGPHRLPSGIGIVAALVDPWHLLVGKKHPLAGRAAVTPADIVPYPSWAPGASVPSEWADYYRDWADFSGITILTGREPGGEPEREDDRARGLFGKSGVLDRIAASDSLSMFAAAGLHLPWHPHIRRLPVLDPTPAYPYALLWSTADPHPALPDLIDHVRQNYSADILADCWIPESDRTIFQP